MNLTPADLTNLPYEVGMQDAVPWPPLAQALARLEVPQPNPLLDQGKETLAGLAIFSDI